MIGEEAPIDTRLVVVTELHFDNRRFDKHLAPGMLQYFVQIALDLSVLLLRRLDGDDAAFRIGSYIDRGAGIKTGFNARIF